MQDKDTMTAATAAPDQATAAEEEEQEEERLPLIAALSAGLRWVEELITALSGFALTVALGVGVIDLASGGRLTASDPNIDMVYAVSLAIGVSGQLVGMASRTTRTWRHNKPLALFYASITVGLGYVEWLAGVVYAFHQTFGETVAASLANMGIAERDFIGIRTAVAVGLVVLSGSLRYQKPKKKKSVEQIIAENERAARIAESNAKLRQARVANAMGVLSAGGRAAVEAARAAGAIARADGEPVASAAGADASVAPVVQLAEAAPAPDVVPTARRLPSSYEASDPAFRRYQLPEGLGLTTLLPITRMADALGVPRSTLSTLWQQASMEYEVARGDQAAGTKNIGVWQVLALVETGLLELPSQVELAEPVGASVRR
jgi:hypothetical protein